MTFTLFFQIEHENEFEERKSGNRNESIVAAEDVATFYKLLEAQGFNCSILLPLFCQGSLFFSALKKCLKIY